MKYQSNAQWPEDTYTGMDGSHVSTDTHSTRSSALAVCKMLQRDGFGGEGKSFPVIAWVTEIALPEPHNK